LPPAEKILPANALRKHVRRLKKNIHHYTGGSVAQS